ncbi:thymidine phosphorylase [Dendrosporobacter sp. 1207_IL3150]|uniref:thymidine phosphorylase n=1 Tax=Dendrosporobacter sp. 1207_IL3150 TaxID=3084054 RepID=UPI002FDAB369
MRMLDIIAQKRNKQNLSSQEIRQVIREYTGDLIPDYQMAAFLMAVCINGMTYEETAEMTLAMAESGKKLDLSDISGIKVDKHSTGGVADTTTLILAPLAASAGVPVAKMSGRGLGFTGGTIDKLESIPGFRTSLPYEEFIANVRKHNLALCSQSNDIAPADGKIYALRDVTATVESIPLIASSIMSKKIAAGADKILLDVKVGSGAFMKDLDSAILLAETMVKIGDIVGRETRAVLTSMDEPLGFAIGNSIEITEAIDVLSGRGKDSLRHLCLTLGAHMLHMANLASNESEGYAELEKLLGNGEALQKFGEFISAQGGDPNIIKNKSLLPQAKYEEDVKSNHLGFVQKIDVAKIGSIATILGAGREYKGQEIDLAAGMTMRCCIGDYISANDVLATIHSNNKEKMEVARNMIIQAITIGNTKPVKPQLILGLVDKYGFQKL